MQAFDGFMVNVALVGSETACEAVRDVQELMYYGFLSVCFGQFVMPFRNDFNHVGRRKIESFLPDLSQTVDAGNRSSRCGALASVAEDELRNDVEKVQAICNLVNEVLNVRGFEIFDRHCAYHFQSMLLRVVFAIDWAP
jgi:hypothetical protein